VATTKEEARARALQAKDQALEKVHETKDRAAATKDRAMSRLPEPVKSAPETAKEHPGGFALAAFGTGLVAGMVTGGGDGRERDRIDGRSTPVRQALNGHNGHRQEASRELIPGGVSGLVRRAIDGIASFLQAEAIQIARDTYHGIRNGGKGQPDEHGRERGEREPDVTVVRPGGGGEPRAETRTPRAAPWLDRIEDGY
jgi:hypothetical protein